MIVQNIILSLLSALIASPISCQMAPYDLSDLGFSTFEMLDYYFYIVTAQFDDYPWVIRVAYNMVLFGCITIGIYFCIWVVKNWRDRRDRRYYRMLLKDYYEDMRLICTDPKPHQRSEIVSKLNSETDRNGKIKHWQLHQWANFFVRLKEENSALIVKENLQQCMLALNILPYIEKQLRFASNSRKKKWIRTVEYLNIDLPESSLARILGHKDRTLQLYARTYYMRKSEFDPFRFLEGGTLTYNIEIAMEIHYSFAERQRKELTLPSLIPLIGVQQDKKLAAFLIREVAFWGTDDDMASILTYFKSNDRQLRVAAFRCVGERKYAEALELLTQAYPLQTEPVRRIILESMSKIDGETMAEFFREAYLETTSNLTKEVALTALWNAGETGHLIFEQLREEADDEHADLFAHTSHALIHRDLTIISK